MTNDNDLAKRADVPLGDLLIIEGYLLPEKFWTKTNKFGVSKTQAVMLAYPNYDRNQAAKQYTRIVSRHTNSSASQSAGQKAQRPRSTTLLVHPGVKVDSTGKDARKIDLLSLESLIPFLKICKKQGSLAADELIDDLAGLSLQQLFSDAFGQKFEQEERRQWWKDRQDGKQVRHTLTDAIKWYLDTNADILSNAYVNFIYSNCSDLVNLGLFGRKSKRLCVDLKVSDRAKLRDALTVEELRWLSEIEDLAARLIIYQEYEPMDAVKEAILRVAIPQVGRTA